MKKFPRPAASLLLALSLSPLFPRAYAEPGHKFPDLTEAERHAVSSAVPGKPAEAPVKPRKILVFYRTEGFVHDSIPIANETLRLMGERTGAFTATLSDDMSAFDPDNLAAYDAVVFVNTTLLAFSDPVHRKALIDFVESGKGLVGIHAASDNFPTWPEGQSLIGGCFHSHPWHANQVVAVKLDEPGHPLNAGFGKRGYWLKEEIYRMKEPYSRAKQRVLVSLDMSRRENERPKDGVSGTEGDHAISWIKTAGKGRVFYTSLGHNKDVYFVPEIQRHFLDGIRFALGDLAADTVPSAALPSRPAPALAPDDKTTLQAIARAKLTADTLSVLAAHRDGLPFGDLTNASALILTLPAKERQVALRTLIDRLERSDLEPESRCALTLVLARVGDPVAVPALEKQAQYAECAVEAATGLALIADKSAGEALIRLVQKDTSPTRITHINALALRRSPEAFPTLAKIAAEGSGDSHAAMQAIAFAGTPDALKTLLALNPGNHADEHNDALIAVAGRILRDDKVSHAGTGALARNLLNHAKPHFRIEAARLLVAAEGAASASELLPLLKDADPLVRRTVARTITLSGDKPAAAALAKHFHDADTGTQSAILAAAYEVASPAALDLVDAGMSSTHAEVKALAIIALAMCGDESAVDRIAPHFAGEREVAAASRTALGLPDSSAFGNRIREALATQSSPVVKAGLLTVLADRRDREGFAIAASLTKQSHAGLRQAAFEVLASLAGSGDLPAILATAGDRKKGADKRAWQKAVFTAATKDKDAVATVKNLSDALATATPEQALVLIGALTQVSGDEASATLRKLLERPDTEGRKEVLRALASARNRNALHLLLESAGKTSDFTERTLALRGYIDTVSALKSSPAERLQNLRAAWPLSGDEEKARILAALKEIKSEEAKKFLKEITPAPAVSTASGASK